MRLIPVLDLKCGVAVRGVGGRRDEYRPIQSVVTPSAEPVTVATRLRERFGFREFYVADLDAIAGAAPAWDVFRDLTRLGLQLLVDIGVRDIQAATQLLAAGVSRVIAALETSPGPEQLRSLVATLGPERLTFSVDLKSGTLLVAGDGWAQSAAPAPLEKTTTEVRPLESGTRTVDAAVDVASRAAYCGVTSLILLDLAGVGEGRGVPTLELCRAVRSRWPQVELITGGGVRGADDLEALEEAGVDGVLVASALHDGSLTPENCARWRS
jgi:phosphoribosylformimino-5-aminoimidazole carboxamide ribotide isomerase